MNQLKICSGKVCSEHGSRYLFDRANAEIKTLNLTLQIKPCACLGRCKTAVNICGEFNQKAVEYSNVTGPMLAQILKKNIT